MIATDNEKVAEVAQGFGADVCMTAPECASGTDRVAEVSQQRGWDTDAVVVNVQGDAPLLPPASIDKVAGLLRDFSLYLAQTGKMAGDVLGDSSLVPDHVDQLR